MSKYMAFETEIFKDRALLVESLEELGFEEITVGEDLLLEGWDKRDERVADVIIRRSDVKNYKLLGDIGFQKTRNGYIAIVDDLDLNNRLGKDFIKRLQTQYHEATARKTAKKLGGTLHKERIGKTIKIRIKY